MTRIQTGPLPWDPAAFPSDTSNFGRGVAVQNPMYGSRSDGGHTPEGIFLAPAMSVPQACEPFWNVSQWAVDIALSVYSQGNSFSTAGTILLDPFPFGTDPVSQNTLAECYGVYGEGDLFWSDGSTQQVTASYFRGLWMNEGDMLNCQLLPPQININTPAGAVDQNGFPQDLGVFNLVAGDTGPAVLMTVAAGSRWPGHVYTVSMELTNFSPQGNPIFDISLTGALSFYPAAFW